MGTNFKNVRFESIKYVLTRTARLLCSYKNTFLRDQYIESVKNKQI